MKCTLLMCLLVITAVSPTAAGVRENMHFASVGGRPVAYHVLGTAPGAPLLLINGGPGFNHSFQHRADAKGTLAGAFDPVCLNLVMMVAFTHQAFAAPLDRSSSEQPRLVAHKGQQPISYIAEFKIKRQSGHGSEWMSLVRKYDQPMLDRLVAEGVVLAWGLDRTILNQAGRSTHRIWVTTADYAGMDKVVAGFNSLDVPQEDVARYLAVANLAEVQERYVHSLVHQLRSDADKVRAFRSYSAFKVKPGKTEDWLKLFEKYERPVLEQLFKEGGILGYGVDVEDVHMQDPGWVWIWIVTASLEGLDRLALAHRRRPETERAAATRALEALTEMGEHRDYLYRTLSGSQAKEAGRAPK